jgi:hypothetical protein
MAVDLVKLDRDTRDTRDERDERNGAQWGAPRIS